MTLTEAAQSMCTTARKLDAWARATAERGGPENLSLARVLHREADRVRAEALECAPLSKPQQHTTAPAERITQETP